MKKDFIFTSESVTEGHPDKLCDLISDAVVDEFLRRDPYSTVIAECAVSTAILFIAARFRSHAMVDLPKVARQMIGQVGYTGEAFNPLSCSILTSLNSLPMEEFGYRDERTMTDEEIDQVTAKNQVTLFGFACNQTAAFMPLPVWLAHKLSRKLTSVRIQKVLPYLEPDGKIQVGVEYVNRLPFRIFSITVIGSQTSSGAPNPKQFADDIGEFVLKPAFSDEPIQPDARTQIFVNPDGPFITGGPSIHSGLTGRKNGVDTYGEYARQSGAALSGKDPSRIDRVGAYAARYAAKNVIAAGLAEECEVQLSYSIGFSRPVSIHVETFRTGIIPDSQITERVKAYFDFRPAAIIRDFNLRWMPSIVKGGFYRKLAAYGHVGRMDIGLPWELTDRAYLLKDS
ncbi:methionine adenosyltransferase [Syntrophus gentianae]|uniref:Methionine adenosyltransferase n=1 Tax=Syntrophus gentianae TaxID=43775 RepID=A0A1H7WWT0_9BACT|nr:methionine adenosyltransferase [Syntrophus gentianae]SEM25329.1 methionine adenosyltransferase [Syntrophus gentianae]